MMEIGKREAIRKLAWELHQANPNRRVRKAEVAREAIRRGIFTRADLAELQWRGVLEETRRAFVEKGPDGLPILICLGIEEDEETGQKQMEWTFRHVATKDEAVEHFTQVIVVNIHNVWDEALRYHTWLAEKFGDDVPSMPQLSLPLETKKPTPRPKRRRGLKKTGKKQRRP
jgi:hypothetical protein